MTARQPALHHGWVVLGIFLIFGGAFFATMLAVACDVEFDVTPYAVCVVGAAIGGWFIGRLSPYRRLNEPLTSSVVMTVVIVACATSTAVGPALWDEPLATIIRRAFILGACSFVGTLIGACLGRGRARRNQHLTAPAPWHLASVSLLLTLGCMAVAFLVWFGLLKPDAISSGASSMSRGLSVVVVLAGVIATSGLMTQMLSAERRPWIAGLGGPLSILSLAILGLIRDNTEQDGTSVVFGALVLFLMVWPVGRIGAGLGWRVRTYVTARREQALPEAQSL